MFELLTPTCRGSKIADDMTVAVNDGDGNVVVVSQKNFSAWEVRVKKISDLLRKGTVDERPSLLLSSQSLSHATSSTPSRSIICQIAE